MEKNCQVQIFRSQNLFSKKFHIVCNIRFFSPTGSLKIIEFSRRFTIRQVLKVISLPVFSVPVFFIFKISLFLVSFECTSGSSMPLFSSFRAFETSSRLLSWINFGSDNMFNSRSWLLYSVSFFPVIYLTNFFETFPDFEFQFFLQSSTRNNTAVPAQLRTFLIPISQSCLL